MYWKQSMDALKAQYKRWRHLKTRKRGRRRVSLYTILAFSVFGFQMNK